MTGQLITVVGAGGIGGNLAGGLALAGERVQVVEVGAHLEAIRERGLRLEGSRGEHVVHFESIVSPSGLRGPLPLVLLATRGHQTAEALAAVAPHLADDGLVVSTQNGLNARLIAARIGERRTIPCMVHVVGALESPGVVGRYTEGELRLGEYDGTVSDRVRALAARLSPAVPAQASGNVWGFIWCKLIHVAQNLATGVVDATAAEVREPEWVRRILVAVELEVVDLATALGVTLEAYERIDPAVLVTLHDEAGLRRALDMLPRASEKGHNGTWRELKRGGKTETSATTEELARLGRERGLPMTLMSELHQIVDGIERRERDMSWDNLRALRERAERGLAARVARGAPGPVSKTTGSFS